MTSVEMDFNKLPVRVSTVADCIVNAERRQTCIFYHWHNHCSLRISNPIDPVNFVLDVRIGTYLNPNRFSCMTPSQNCRYNTEEGHCAVGKCATGNLKPPSLRNINCMRCVAISTDEFPAVIQ